MITIAVAAGVGTLGFDNCIARFTALYLGNGDLYRIRGLIRHGITRGLLFSVGVAICLFGLMRTGVLDRTRLAPLSHLSVILMLGIPLYALQLTLLQTVLGLQRVKSRILLERILQPVLRLLFPFLVLLWKSNPTSAAVCSLVVSAAVVDAVGVFVLLSEVRKLPKASPIDTREKRRWLGYAVPFVFYSLQNFLWAGMGLDVFLVGALMSLHDAGIYAAALRLLPVLALARGAMDYTFGPRAGILFGQSDFKSIGVLYRSTSTMALAWTLPLAVILAVFGQAIMRNFFGTGYEAGGVVLGLLVAGLVVDSATGCNTTLLSMGGRSGLVLVNGLAGGVTVLILGLVMIPRWGIAGAGFATSCSIIIVNILATMEAWKLYGLQPFSPTVVKVGLAGVLVAGFGVGWRRWVLPMLQPGMRGLALSACATLFVYLGILLTMTRGFRTLYMGETERPL
jgi:O-antigen/teichoic acid export membrane protein